MRAQYKLSSTAISLTTNMSSIIGMSKYAILSACGVYVTYALSMRKKKCVEKMKIKKLEEKQMELINMDGVGVPKRVLRKAETVLTRRTDRLSIVIERSTNSQNYTAVLRSAEALGVQNIYLISNIKSYICWVRRKLIFLRGLGVETPKGKR